MLQLNQIAAFGQGLLQNLLNEIFKLVDWIVSFPEYFWITSGIAFGLSMSLFIYQEYRNKVEEWNEVRIKHFQNN